MILWGWYDRYLRVATWCKRVWIRRQRCKACRRSHWLVVEKRRLIGSGKTPFSARIPLAAVTDVRAGSARMAVVGSLLSFVLVTGGELRFDLPAGQAVVERAAQRFRDAIREAWLAPPLGPATLEVTSPPPPPRTPAGLAALLVMASIVPFVIAMAGARKGPFADVAALCLIFLALGLQLVRPVSMPRLLAGGAWLAAAAFGLDTLRTGETPRLLGVACCIALAMWMGTRRGSLPPTAA